jgi:hypothetical protein
MVLFGGSIICGGDVLAEAIQNQVSEKYIIVGGAGHTTQTLRDRVHKEYPSIETQNKPEAEIFSNYINKKYNLQVDYLEKDSTNCGNNITNLLDLIEKNNIKCKYIILSQDATMQRRMSVTLRKYRPDMISINYATYKAEVIEKENELTYAKEIKGMWNMERYISLLMGEIPRLRDDENGYGPKGKGFIAHEDIPDEVNEAFETLKLKYDNLIRVADSKYATK